MNNFDCAIRVIKILQDAGFTAYMAGGVVRDFLLGHPCNDIDIATSADVKDIRRLFSKTIAVGIQFGIIIVVLEEHHFEVATFRKEEGHHDGRRPTKVHKACPKEDALRRDFTINGMFYDPIQEAFFDYVQGEKDLNEKVVKAIGDPHERFLEDRLRMIRAARYAARFSFAIDPDTIEAIISHAKDLFPSVAIERVYDELKKMAGKSSTFCHSIKLLHRLHLLGVIFPSLKGLSQNTIDKKLLALEHQHDIPAVLMIMQLFYHDSLTKKIQILEYLKTSTKEKDLVLHLEQCQKIAGMDDYARTHLYANKNTYICLTLILQNEGTPEKMHTYQQEVEDLQPWITRVVNNDAILKAKDLIELGIPPSQKLGNLLQKAEQISINERIKDKKLLLKRLMQEGS